MKRILTTVSLALLPLAAFASTHGASGMNWFSEQIVRALIHGVIYGVIYKLFRAMGLGPSVLVAALVLGGAYLWWKKKQQTP